MPRVRSDIDRGESLPVPLPPIQQKYLSLEGYTVSNRATPGDSMQRENNSLEGCTPAKMAARAALAGVVTCAAKVSKPRRLYCESVGVP